MSVLEKIIAVKRREVAEAKELFPIKWLEKSIYYETPCVSLKQYLRRQDRVGVIAEIKRRSPSRGDINQNISVERLSIGYMQAGASALSVLTDKEFFGGSAEDLKIARRFNYCPILRKDFIVDEYQLVEAKAIGADVALLIGRALPAGEIKRLAAFATSLGLEVLLEIHSLKDLEEAFCGEIDLIGVNNRNLAEMSVDLQRSFELVEHLPEGIVKISESGIENAAQIVQLKRAGFDGFLMGQLFMQSGSPEQACAEVIRDVSEILGDVGEAHA
ncbi:MAG: indole-3-glycerol phosphate synthase TrpC [Deltaproteobacteria bacterium]|nr:indole-3-glycerol phosphate synthase TrpC [Deltaproteobacteria bacterium]